MKRTYRVTLVALLSLASLTGASFAASASTLTPPTAAAKAVATATKASPPLCTTAMSFGSGAYVRWVPTTSTGSRSCYLAKNANSQGVLSLQAALQECEGYPVNGVDGNFGPGTQSGLKAFQRARGLKVDGSYYVETHNAIRFPSNSPAGGAWFVCNADSRL